MTMAPQTVTGPGGTATWTWNQATGQYDYTLAAPGGQAAQPGAAPAQAVTGWQIILTDAQINKWAADAMNDRRAIDDKYAQDQQSFGLEVAKTNWERAMAVYQAKNQRLNYEMDKQKLGLQAAEGNRAARSQELTFKMQALQMLADRKGPQDWVAYNRLVNGLSAPTPEASQKIDVFAEIGKANLGEQIGVNLPGGPTDADIGGLGTPYAPGAAAPPATAPTPGAPTPALGGGAAPLAPGQSLVDPNNPNGPSGVGTLAPGSGFTMPDPSKPVNQEQHPGQEWSKYGWNAPGYAAMRDSGGAGGFGTQPAAAPPPAAGTPAGAVPPSAAPAPSTPTPGGFGTLPPDWQAGAIQPTGPAIPVTPPTPTPGGFGTLPPDWQAGAVSGFRDGTDGYVDANYRVVGEEGPELEHNIVDPRTGRMMIRVIPLSEEQERAVTRRGVRGMATGGVMDMGLGGGGYTTDMGMAEFQRNNPQARDTGGELSIGRYQSQPWIEGKQQSDTSRPVQRGDFTGGFSAPPSDPNGGTSIYGASGGAPAPPAGPTIEVNKYSQEQMGNQPFLNKLRGTSPAPLFTGYGKSIDAPDVGIYDLPAVPSLQNYNRLLPSEQLMAQGSYEAAGQYWADILEKARRAAPTGRTLGPAMYGGR